MKIEHIEAKVVIFYILIYHLKADEKEAAKKKRNKENIEYKFDLNNTSCDTFCYT